MNNIIIKKVLPQEVKLLALLEKDIFYDTSEYGQNYYTLPQLTNMYDNSAYTFIAAWSDGRMIGYTIILDSYDLYEIIKIGVNSKHRKCGIATKLLNYVLSITVSTASTVSGNRSFKDILLEVRSSNSPAIHFYEKLGFVYLNKRKGYYGDTGEDALVYIKNFM